MRIDFTVDEVTSIVKQFADLPAFTAGGNSQSSVQYKVYNKAEKALTAELVRLSAIKTWEFEVKTREQTAKRAQDYLTEAQTKLAALKEA